jgi:hypothetical protein
VSTWRKDDHHRGSLRISQESSVSQQVALAVTADLALVTAGAEIRMAGGWALMGKFGGRVGQGTQIMLAPRACGMWGDFAVIR